MFASEGGKHRYVHVYNDVVISCLLKFAKKCVCVLLTELLLPSGGQQWFHDLVSFSNRDFYLNGYRFQAVTPMILLCFEPRLNIQWCQGFVRGYESLSLDL
jgi:hypothetical protein